MQSCELKDRVVVTCAVVAVGDTEVRPPEQGDEWVPWGAPMSAVIDDVVCVMQAWRQRAARAAGKGKGSGGGGGGRRRPTPEPAEPTPEGSILDEIEKILGPGNG